MNAALGFAQGFAAAILALAAVMKLVARVDLEPFLASVGVSRSLSRVLARLVVPAEATCAVLLVAGAAARIVAPIAFAVSLGFLGVQIRALRDRNSAGCRCFGHLDTGDKGLAAGQAALLAVVLLAASVLAFVETGASVESAPRIFGALSGIGGVLALALAGEIVTFRRLRPHLADGLRTRG